MTFVVVGDNRVLDQVRKQLEKIVTVVKVVDISAQNYVERDLMLLKVKAPPGGTRSDSVTVQVTDPEAPVVAASSRSSRKLSNASASSTTLMA